MFFAIAARGFCRYGGMVSFFFPNFAQRYQKLYDYEQKVFVGAPCLVGDMPGLWPEAGEERRRGEGADQGLFGQERLDDLRTGVPRVQRLGPDFAARLGWRPHNL